MDPLWEVVGKTKEEKTNNITSVLKAIPIFSDLSPKELREVEKIIYHRHYKEGEFGKIPGFLKLHMSLQKPGFCSDM